MKWWVWAIAAVVVIGVIGNIVNPAPKVTIPDLAGKPAVEAAGQLKELGFTVTLKNGDKTVIAGKDFDVESSVPAAGEDAREGSKVTLQVGEATERLASEAERLAAEKEAADAKKQAESDANKAELAASQEDRAGQLEQSIKNAFGGAEFTELLAEDPTMWVGWISGVRVDGSNAYITLQLYEEGPGDDIGDRAAKALSTLLSREDVKGISWIIVEDAAGVVIGQQQPTPIY